MQKGQQVRVIDSSNQNLGTGTYLGKFPILPEEWDLVQSLNWEELPTQDPQVPHVHMHAEDDVIHAFECRLIALD